jgi:ribosomal-protein-alanine acetyltransferase
MPNDPVEIRQIENRDLASILSIQSETGLSVWSQIAYQNEILRDDSIFLVASISITVVGFIVARHTNKGIEQKTANIEIYNIGVDPEHQKKGIGSLLIQEIIGNQTLRPAEIWLEVRYSNFAAISFYEKHSFESIGIRKSFFSNPTEDAVLMKCET